MTYNGFDTLREALDAHNTWCSDPKRGKRLNLSGAYLSGAYLSGANLSDANLSDANLSDANLSDANLSGAYFSGANLSGAYLSGAYLSGAEVLLVGNIDAQILAAVTARPDAFDMSVWHQEKDCGTTHCRAGWAIALAGDAGYALEKAVGPALAGALIYARARAGKRVPDFYASNDVALASIREDAAPL